MAGRMMYSGRDMMAFSPIKTLAIQGVFKLADWFGFWHDPVDLDIEGVNNYHMLVWFYTSGRPITRAEKGSGLEVFFAKQRQNGIPTLPAGFQKQSTITMSAVGDLMCNSALEHSADIYYRGVADQIFDADIAFANLESTLTSHEIPKPTLSLDALPKINATSAQYDIVSGYQGRRYSIFQLANNHILDHGMEGILTTRQRLDNDGIPHIGTNLSAEEQKRGVIVEKNGLRLGFVAATFGVNFMPFPEGKPYAVNQVRFHQYHTEVDLSLLEQQIAWCREQGCDLVIACLHWGVEWEFYPRAYQVNQAHQLAEAGADVIIGHHAHVIQPMEWYQTRRDPDRWVPIFYNLGNLVPLVTAPFSALSLVARLTLARGQVNGIEKMLVENAHLTPVIQLHQEQDGKVRVWLDKLRALVAHPASDEEQYYTAEAAIYADLVLGRDWRKEHR